MYQSTSPKYHEPIKDWDMEDNYDLDFLEWAYVNYPITFLYDDA